MSVRKVLVDALVAFGLFVFLMEAQTIFQVERTYQNGARLEANGLHEQAAVIYRNALAITPDRFEIQRALGRAAMKSYRPGSRNLRPLFMAQAAFRAATELNPWYPYGWQELGEANLKLWQAKADDVPNPERFFRQALAIDPGNPRFLAALMRWQIISGQRTRAWETFVRLIDADPVAIRAYGNLIAPEAKDVERLRREVAGNEPQTVQLARLLYSRTEFGPAEELLRALPTDRQLEPDAAPLLAHVLRQQKRFDEAEKALTDALVRNPDNLYLARDLGGLLVVAKKNRAAVELFERTISAHPDQLWFQLEAAIAATTLGELDSAAKWYDAALASGRLDQPQTVKALLGLAEVRRRQGKIRSALIACERLIEIDPDNPRYLRMAENLRLELDRQQ